MPDDKVELNWHQRFQVQARWTEKLRQFLYQQVKIKRDSRLLEVGCGTGVITSDLVKNYSNSTFGIDTSFQRLKLAVETDHSSNYSSANTLDLPFSDNTFDFVISHYFLLWVLNPQAALVEMKRVLVPGGTILALAEPDHDSRIDFPPEFEKLGEIQTRSLANQGADTSIGRRLPEFFSNSGLRDIQFGAPGFQTEISEIPDWWDSEWQVLRTDLLTTLSDIELSSLQQRDAETRKNGSRVLWVPTFYAFGKK